MNRSEAIFLNDALSTTGLRVKFLSAGSYATLLELKRPLRRFLNEMGQDEKELLEEYGLSAGDPIPKDDGFKDKLKVVQDKEFTTDKLNFLTMEEFKKFTDDIDFGTASILADALLISNGKTDG